MSVHSEMYNPQLPLYSSNHHNLPSTHHFDEMFCSRPTTRNPFPSPIDSATFTFVVLSMALSCVGWYLLGLIPHIFHDSSISLLPPASLESLLSPSPAPFKDGVHHSSIVSPQLFSFHTLTLGTSSGPWILCPPSYKSPTQSLPAPRPHLAFLRAKL